jgi:transposase-like protein
MTDRTTVRLPEELKERAVRLAAEEGRTLTSLIEEGLRSVISQRRTEPKPRVMPRVSKARGWLAPGIKDLKEIQEIEDAEYVEKLRRL